MASNRARLNPFVSYPGTILEKWHSAYANLHGIKSRPVRTLSCCILVRYWKKVQGVRYQKRYSALGSQSVPFVINRYRIGTRYRNWYRQIYLRSQTTQINKAKHQIAVMKPLCGRVHDVLLRSAQKVSYYIQYLLFTFVPPLQ